MKPGTGTNPGTRRGRTSMSIIKQMCSISAAILVGMAQPCAAQPSVSPPLLKKGVEIMQHPLRAVLREGGVFTVALQVRKPGRLLRTPVNGSDPQLATYFEGGTGKRGVFPVHWSFSGVFVWSLTERESEVNPATFALIRRPLAALLEQGLESQVTSGNRPQLPFDSVAPYPLNDAMGEASKRCRQRGCSS